MGGNFEEFKSNIFLIGKIMNWKNPSNRFNHLSMMFASIWPSNMGMSKLTCNLKGVAPLEWLLDEDVLPVGSHQRIWGKFSIIALPCHSRASLRNIWKYPLLPHLYFLSPWEIVGVCEVSLAKVQLVWTLTPYTLTLLGTCKEKWRKRRPLRYH